MSSLLSSNGGSLMQDPPSFEEVLRLQAEEEEEDARQLALQKQLGGIGDYDEDGDDLSSSARAAAAAANDAAAEEAAMYAAEQAVADANQAAPASPFSLQPCGWLTLERANAAGESKKRWCSLQRGFLFYAGTNRDLRHPKGVVDLKGCDVSLARVDGTATALPCAFVLSHPRRTPLTFVAPSEMEREAWMHALLSAIRAPTHALLRYKGRAIFDAEDAAAISNSQAAIRGFVASQFERLASRKREEEARIARKKAEIKLLKAAKKQLAKELIGATASFDEASAQSEALQSELESVQKEDKSYETVQREFLLKALDLLNQMEESDPNRWNGPLSSNTFSGNSHTSPSASNGLYDSMDGEDGIGSDSFSSSSVMPLPASAAMFTSPASRTQQPSSLSTGARSRSQAPSLSSMTFSGTSSHLLQRSAGGGHRSTASMAGKMTSSSTVLSPQSTAIVSAAAAAAGDSIEISNEQLEFVQEQLTQLMQTPLQVESMVSPSQASSSFTSLASSPTMGNGLPSLPSFSSGDALLSRTDSIDLTEIKQISLDLLQSNLQLRKEQNALTRDIGRRIAMKSLFFSDDSTTLPPPEF